MANWLLPLLSSVWVWTLRHPWSWVQSHLLLSALSTAGGFVIAFGKKVWGRLEPKAVDAIAEGLEHRTTTIFARYHKRYVTHLYWKHRTFDVKGFSTQGKYALELENVYVDLGVDPAAVGTISQDPIRLPKDAEKSSDRSIFVWLKAEFGRPCNFAIVGPPGSGKSTLLKSNLLGALDSGSPLLQFRLAG